jgi:hypothetical protein
MLKTVVAIERDGFDIRTLTLQFDVPSKDFDLESAVKNAATDYCKTTQGKAVYQYNCNYFNWADFAMNVSNEFCEKYGFKMIDSVCEDIIVDWDEQLVNDIDCGDEEEA